jgi:outer membrane receptor protein involved in Fe transport
VDFPPAATDSGLPLLVVSLGNPDPKTETFVDAEAGYRLEIGAAASIDVTGFVGRYDHLLTHEATAPVVRFAPSPAIVATAHGDNLLKATTNGLELGGHWSPIAIWRLDGSYTAFRLVPTVDVASRDLTAATTDGSAPRAQWQLRSAFSPVSRATFNVALFHVGPLERFNVVAYTRTDVSAEWRFTPQLAVMAIGQNLFDEAHPEFSTAGSFLMSTQVARTASLRLRWTFR